MSIFTKQNFEFIIKELIKTMSTRPSFFSKKRVEGSVAFIISQIGMVAWLVLNVMIMNVGEIIAWATIELFIAGYYVSQIQKEKQDNKDIDKP